jgi:hypothetical protein
MVARFAGATLGLLAFTITVVAGVLAHNPVTVTLSRSVLALLVFCLIGLVVGSAAQAVVVEHERSRTREIRERYPRDAGEPAGDGPQDEAVEEGEGATVGV